MPVTNSAAVSIRIYENACLEKTAIFQCRCFHTPCACTGGTSLRPRLFLMPSRIYLADSEGKERVQSREAGALALVR
jgi:hypothetical protein